MAVGAHNSQVRERGATLARGCGERQPMVAFSEPLTQLPVDRCEIEAARLALQPLGVREHLPLLAIHQPAVALSLAVQPQ